MSYRRVVNTRNLESKIRKSLRALEADEQEAKKTELEKVEKATQARQEKIEKVAGKPKSAKRVIHRVSGILLGLVLLSFGVVWIITGVQTAQRHELDNLTDARLISYENMIYEVKKVVLLFGIYDDASYQLARTTIHFSDELAAKYFISENYSGITQPEVRIEYQNILYELTENDYVNYLVYFKRYQGDEVTQYVIRATYKDNSCVDLMVLN